MGRAGRKSTAVLILLVFSAECTGLDHLSSVVYAEEDGLRPAATLVSGMQPGGTKSSSAAKTGSRQFNPSGKGRPGPEKETSALSALVFVLGVAGTFYLSLRFTHNIYIIFGAPFAVAVGLLAWFRMLKDMIMFIPRHLKKSLNVHRGKVQRMAAKEARVQKQTVRKDRKAQKAAEYRQLLAEAYKILDKIFAENDPAKFKDYDSFAAALDHAFKTELVKKQRKMNEVKLRVESFKEKAKDYFVQKQIEKEQAKKAEQLRQAHEDLTAKRKVLAEARAEMDRARNDIVEWIAEARGRLDTYEPKATGFEKEARAELDRAREQAITGMQAVDSKLCTHPDEYLRKLKAAVVPEAQKDTEIGDLLEALNIRDLFDALYASGSEEISNRMLRVCKKELLGVELDKDKDEFSTSMEAIRARYSYMPGIDELIEQRWQQQLKYEQEERTANALLRRFTIELDRTKQKSNLHRLNTAECLIEFIKPFSNERRQRWFNKLNDHLSRKYIQIADEQLNILREEGLEAIYDNKHIKIITSILNWLKEQQEREGFDWLKSECNRISLELYKISKGPPKAAGAAAKAAPEAQREQQPPAKEEPADVQETIDFVNSWFRQPQKAHEKASVLGDCCDMLLLLDGVEPTGKHRQEVDRLKVRVLNRLLESAIERLKDPQYLSAEQQQLLEDLPKIVVCVYIIASTGKGNPRAAGIIWRDKVIPELVPLLEKDRVDPARLSAVYEKLTKELGMPTPKELEKNKGIVERDTFIALCVVSGAVVFLPPLLALGRIIKAVVDRWLSGLRPQDEADTLMDSYYAAALKDAVPDSEAEGTRRRATPLDILENSIIGKRSQSDTGGGEDAAEIVVQKAAVPVSNTAGAVPVNTHIAADAAIASAA